MKDKKIIFIAIILAVLIIGYGWYYKKTHPSPTATIFQSESISPERLEKAEGIIVGKEDAPVVIEEYTNFLCPACGNFAVFTMPQIEEKYIKTGQVKLVFYIFPPLELSQASLCADDQKKFLEYHDYLFSHRSELASTEDLKTMAEKAGLDKEAFNRCLESEKYKELATAWYNNGIERGVEATPTFYINGEQIVGAYPFEKFEEIIKRKLAE